MNGLWALSVLFRLVVGKKNETEDVGVCWTRNNVIIDDGNIVKGQWIQLKASLLTLRRQPEKIRTCLFTDAPKDLVPVDVDHVIEEKSLQMFLHHVIDKDLGMLEMWHEIEKHTEKNATAKLVAKAAGRNLFITRMKRIYNFGRSPFHLTLFLDDDTVFCKTPTFLGALRNLSYTRRRLHVHMPRTVIRIAEQKLVHSENDIESFRECLRSGEYCWPPTCESFFPGETPQHLALQGGAVVVEKGADDKKGPAHFAEALLRSYLQRWGTTPQDPRFGMDQPPFDALVESLCGRSDERNSTELDDYFTFAGLPPNYNVRWFGKTGYLDGAVFVLHTHFFSRHFHDDDDPQDFLNVVDGMCNQMNSDLGPRSLHLHSMDGYRFGQLAADLRNSTVVVAKCGPLDDD